MNLRIGNFKAFGTTQRIPLRPITLLYGANSAGKSSIIHALALTHEAFKNGTLDVHRTDVGGDSIDLGGFAQYVHRKDRQQLVTLGFELGDVGVLPKPDDEDVNLVTLPQTVLEVRIGESRRNATERPNTPGGSRGRLERWTLEVDGAPLLVLSAQGDLLMTLGQLDVTHPSLQQLLANYLNLPGTARDIRECGIDTLLSAWASLPKLLVYGGLRPKKPLAFPAASPHLESASTALSHVLKALFDGIDNTLDYTFGDMQYLGPLRSLPPRHLLGFPAKQDPNWYSGGGYAWEEVRRNRDLRQLVNWWLGDPNRLKTPYELKVRHLLPSDVLQSELPDKLGPKLYELAHYILEDVELGKPRSAALTSALEKIRQNPDMEPDAADESFLAVGEVVDAIVDAYPVAEEWVKEIVGASGTETREELVLVDERFGISVSPRDVGVGVSQVLPVLVSAYGNKEAFIAIEQPELHLHPALQAELGDLFLESALGFPENNLIIETHSEHLMLRILRRIRETSEGELPKGAPPVKPEDVAVLFVQPGSEGAQVIELPITPDGDFARRWPGGFFAERAKELF